MIKVLFVCTGNICRSPTAAAIFKSMITREGLDREIIVDSAGTADYHVGEMADKRTIYYGNKRGYNLSAHRARQITMADFSLNDYILAMDWDNIRALKAVAPDDYRKKAQLLMRYSNKFDVAEVPDPYYGLAEGFLRVIDYCEDACSGFLQHLRDSYGLRSKPYSQYRV